MPSPRRRVPFGFSARNLSKATGALKEARKIELSRRAEARKHETIEPQKLPETSDEAVSYFMDLASIGYNPSLGWNPKVLKRIRVVYYRLSEAERRKFAAQILNSEELPYDLRVGLFSELKKIEDAKSIH